MKSKTSSAYHQAHPGSHHNHLKNQETGPKNQGIILANEVLKIINLGFLGFVFWVLNLKGVNMVFSAAIKARSLLFFHMKTEILT